MNPKYAFDRIKQALFHRVTQNTGYQLLGKVVTAITGLIIIKLVAQYYGQNGVGELTLIFNYITIFYLFTDFGLNAIIVKLMIDQPDKEEIFYSNLLGLRIIASLFLTVLAMAILYFLPYDPIQNTGYSPIFKQGATLLLITLLTQSIYLSAMTIFQKSLAYVKATLALGIGSIVTCIIFFFLIQLHTPFTLTLSAYVVGNTITAFLALRLLPIRKEFRFEARYSIQLWRSFIIPALPLATMVLLNIVYFKADTFILAKLKPVEDVGIYGMAYRIFEQALVIPIYFVNALYPIMVEQVHRAKPALYQTLRFSIFALFTTGIIAGFVLYIGAPYFVVLIGNNTFMASVAPLRVLVIALPIFFVSNIFLWLLVTLSKQKYLLIIYGCSMIINIVGNLLLIPRYSYMAAAWLTTISEVIVLFLTALVSLYFLRKAKVISKSDTSVNIPVTE